MNAGACGEEHLSLIFLRISSKSGMVVVLDAAMSKLQQQGHSVYGPGVMTDRSGLREIKAGSGQGYRAHASKGGQEHSIHQEREGHTTICKGGQVIPRQLGYRSH